MEPNLDRQTVDGFGHEWARFNQSALGEAERQQIFDSYFRLFPWDALPDGARGADVGCGSGRWAMCTAPRVGHLHCIDASSQALDVARQNLSGQQNVSFDCASVANMPIEDGSLDFVYSLGVLHHIPDTAAGIKACASKLKPGGVFLVYLYYAFDNRPPWFRRVWQASELARKTISRMPARPKQAVCDAVAASVYWPAARASRALSRLGMDVENIPLSAYRDKSFYTMRTDALDRFGTRLEQRFTAAEIRDMMAAAGLEQIEVCPEAPYWTAIGTRPGA